MKPVKQLKHYIILALLAILILAANVREMKAQGTLGTPNATEAAILMTFFNATGGNTWINKTGWGNNSALFWFGVYVNASGNVVRLVLYTNNIIGDASGISLVGLTSLQYFYCSVNQLISLPALPNSLTYLSCGGNLLSSLPVLPNSLTFLSCDSTQLTSLPTLPNSLQKLYCQSSQIRSLPSLPNSLTILDCDTNQLTSLPNLPNSLLELYSSNNPLMSLPSLPNSLITLHCFYNQLRNLPVLPNSLGTLYCNNNQLTNLPALPSNLNWLYCPYNPLISLPSLPSSLQRLDCNNNQLTSLPNLPNSLLLLFCQNSQLTSLPNLPNSLQTLVCFNNQLTSLPNLPSNLNFGVSCGDNQLDFADLETISPKPPRYYIANPQSYTILPATQSVTVGTSIVINGTIGGTLNQYQWYKDGSPIGVPSTNGTYTKTGATSADAGVYKCEVTSTYVGVGTTTGVTITSSEVRATVIDCNAKKITSCTQKLVTGMNTLIAARSGSTSGLCLEGYTGAADVARFNSISPGSGYSMVVPLSLDCNYLTNNTTQRRLLKENVIDDNFCGTTPFPREPYKKYFAVTLQENGKDGFKPYWTTTKSNIGYYGASSGLAQYIINDEDLRKDALEPIFTIPDQVPTFPLPQPIDAYPGQSSCEVYDLFFYRIPAGTTPAQFENLHNIGILKNSNLIVQLSDIESISNPRIDMRYYDASKTQDDIPKYIVFDINVGREPFEAYLIGNYAQYIKFTESDVTDRIVIDTTTITTPICSSATFSVPFTTNCTSASASYSVGLYNVATGAFYPDVAVSTTSPISVTFPASLPAGPYDLVITSSEGYTSLPKRITIAVSATFTTPTFTNPTTATANNGTITGSMSVSTAGTYILKKNGVAIGTSISYSCATGTCTVPFNFTGLGVGNYQIEATSADGCVTNSSVITLTAPIDCNAKKITSCTQKLVVAMNTLAQARQGTNPALCIEPYTGVGKRFNAISANNNGGYNMVVPLSLDCNLLQAAYGTRERLFNNNILDSEFCTTAPFQPELYKKYFGATLQDYTDPYIAGMSYFKPYWTAVCANIGYFSGARPAPPKYIIECGSPSPSISSNEIYDGVHIFSLPSTPVTSAQFESIYSSMYGVANAPNRIQTSNISSISNPRIDMTYYNAGLTDDGSPKYIAVDVQLVSGGTITAYLATFGYNSYIKFTESNVTERITVVNPITTPICGSTISIPFTTNCTTAGATYTVGLYQGNNFLYPNLGTSTTSPITVTFPANIPAGSYDLVITSSEGYTSVGMPITIPTPTITVITTNIPAQTCGGEISVPFTTNCSVVGATYSVELYNLATGVLVANLGTSATSPITATFPTTITAGQYNLVVRSSQGIVSVPIAITIAPAHTFTSTFTNPTTATAIDGIIMGSITVTSAGTYILKRGNVSIGTAQSYSCPSSSYPCTITATFNNLGVGNYQIVATSVAGCTTTSNVIVLTVPPVLCGTNCQDKQVTSCTQNLIIAMTAIRKGNGIVCLENLGSGSFGARFNSASRGTLPSTTNFYNMVVPLSLDCNYTTTLPKNPTRTKLLNNNVLPSDFCGNLPFSPVPYKKYFGVTLQQKLYSFNPIWRAKNEVNISSELGAEDLDVAFPDPKYIIQGDEKHITTYPMFATPPFASSPSTIGSIPNPIDDNPDNTVNAKYEIYLYRLPAGTSPQDFEKLYDINELRRLGLLVNTNHVFALRNPRIDCNYYDASQTQDDIPKYIMMDATVDTELSPSGKLTVYMIANYAQYIKFTESKVTERIVIASSTSVPTQICKGTTFTVPFTTNCTSPDATYSVGLYQGANFYPDLGVSTTSPISVTIPNDPTLVAGLAQLVITSSEGYTSAPIPITIATGLSAISAQVAGNGEANGTCSNYTYNLTAIGDASYTYTWEIERIGTRTGMQVSVTLPEQIEGVEFILTATSGGCSISVRGVIRNVSTPLPQITIGSTTSPTCKNPTAGSISVFIGGQKQPSRYGTPVLYQNGTVVFGIDPVTDCPRLVSAWGCTYDYTGLSAGDYEIIYTYGNGCTVSSGTITLALPPIRTTLTINNTLNPSCGNTGNGSITATLSGIFETIPRKNTFVTLYQEGVPMGATLPFGCSGRVTKAGCSFALDFPNLPAGNYEIVVIDANGCRISSGNIALITTAPVVTVCAQPLSCSPIITPKINIIANYPNAPANFGNKFSCKIFRQNGGALMKTTTINTGATTITLDQTLPAEKIIVGETVLIQLTPLVNCIDPACSVFEEDKCIVSYAVTFDQPVLTVNLAKNIDSPALPVITTVANVLTYEICQFPLIVDASVSSSNICGVPDVYTWNITKNNPTTGAVTATVPNTDGTFTITEALGAGTYTATVTHSTLGCVASKTFDVRIIAPPKVNVTTTDQICSRNGTASAGINDYTGGVTYAWELLPTQIATVGTPVLDATGGQVVGAQIDNLLPGYYQCIVTIPSGCIFKTPFTIKGAIKILQNPTQDIVISNTVNNQIGCEVTATGIVVFPTIPVGTSPASGIFQVEWHYLKPKRDEDGNLIGADNQPLPLVVNNVALTPAQYEASIVFEDIVVFTETVNSARVPNPTDPFKVISNLPIDKFEASIYPNALYSRGKYYVVIKDVNDCPFTSPVQELRKPNASREWEMCLSWEDPDPVIKPVVVPPINTAAIAASEAITKLDERVKACVKRQKEIAEIIMGAQCDSAVTDDFSFSYEQKTHHYTLYYYDRAGRLTKTVPPQGVSPLKIGDKDAQNQTIIEISRVYVPAHTMPTTYEYNSLGQLVSQKTPDGGTSNFIYDNKGQLRFSQNDKQKISEQGAYSYTYYDALGRINEVGQSKARKADPNYVADPNYPSIAGFPDFRFDVNKPLHTNSIKSGNEDLVNNVDPVIAMFPFDLSGNPNNNEQITHTVYTEAEEDIYYFTKEKTQRNLQNRVSYTYTLNKGDNDLSKAAYTYYSYDVHGNVEWMVQDVPGMGKNYIAYEYDLISGKVLKVSYNENRKDKFFHRYDYDEDNRLTKVETSKDGNMWDTDAVYDYYKHGPLKRVGLGEGQIQGLDYVYTIHGWLKGINSPVNGQADDIGLDGVAGTNLNVAKDAFGMALGYYKEDYKSDNTTFSYINASGVANQFSLQADDDLYNGNISAWTTTMSYYTAPPATPAGGVGTWANKAYGSKFRYDKLNRIKSSREYAYNGTGATGAWASEGTKLATNYTYDANGNIKNLTRRDHEDKEMDNLGYVYDRKPVLDPLTNAQLLDPVTGDPITTPINRLNKVSDSVLPGTPTNGLSMHDKDIEGGNDYLYDEIGNLIRDEKEKIDITWTAYGKVSTVTPTSYNNTLALDAPENKKKTLRYLYDASGNRIMKEAKTLGGFGANNTPIFKPEGITTTYYVRDAQGNVMSTYERTNKATNDPTMHQATFKQSEISLYGSDRLGQYKPDNIAAQALYNSTNAPNGDNNNQNTPNFLVTERITENKNLITTTDNLTSTVTAHAGTFDIKKINNADWTSASTTLQNNMVGTSGENVAIAENLKGEMQLYAVVAKDYFGQPNVCLLYDKNGLLVNLPATATTGIKADYTSKSIFVRHPKEADKYWLITRGTDNYMYRTEVQIAANGTATITYLNKAIGLKPITNDPMKVGAHFTAVEDNTTSSVLVYLTSNDPATDKKAQLVLLKMTESVVTAPITIQTLPYTETDNYNGGDLQISADGKQLLWYHLGQRAAFFDYQQAMPYSFALSENMAGIVAGAPISTQSLLFTLKSKASIDIDQSAVIYFTQKDIALTGNNTLWKSVDLGVATNANVNNSTEVRRGVDGIMHQAQVYVGSGLPVQVHTLTLTPLEAPTRISASRLLRVRNYELKDHLGNVRVIVSDQKDENAAAQVQSYYNYYAFGMEMPGRTYEEKSYRYGFNGKENDKDFGTAGLTQDYGFRLYNPAIAKFLSVDPLTKKFPMLTPYQLSSNNPISMIDIDGLEGVYANNIMVKKTGQNTVTITADVLVQFKVLNLSSKEDYEFDMSTYNSTIADYIKSQLNNNSATAKHAYLGPDNVLSTPVATYKLNVSVNFTSVSSLDQIKDNDFAIVVVDALNDTFTDKFGKAHNTGAHVVGGTLTIMPAKYMKASTASAQKLAKHEFFHVLGLDDIEDKGKESNLMYHLGGRTGEELTDQQRGEASRQLFDRKIINNKSTYSSEDNSVKSKIKSEMKKSKYEISDDKAKTAKVK